MRPATSITFSPIGRNIEFPQSQRFSEWKPECNWQYREASISTNDYRGQHDIFYYQPQTANYNQRQHYFCDRTTQQAPYITYYK